MNQHQFNQQLVLIKLVNQKYQHISQLEALGTIYTMIDEEEDKEKLAETEISYSDKLHIIVRTTQNSHYNYRLYRLPMFQNVSNHIDNLVDDEMRIIVRIEK